MSNASKGFSFEEGDKFALLGIEMVFSDRPAESENRLTDETWVLTQLPVHPDSSWKEWIGSLRYDRLKRSNIVLLRKRNSASPEVLDAEHEELGKALSRTFYLLQLSGVLEYEDADLLKGSVLNGNPNNKTDEPTNKVSANEGLHAPSSKSAAPRACVRAEEWT